MPPNFAPPFATPGYPGAYPGQPMVQQPAAPPYPQQPFAPPPNAGFAAAPAQAPWNATAVPTSNPPRPIFRAQADDDPAPTRRRVPAVPPPAPLSMPSPEQLGVTANQPAAGQAIDWASLHTRLDQLGATCFHLERPSAGVFRITCLLPTGQAGRTHCIAAQAGSEAEAVRLTLTQAEEWAGQR